MEMNKEQGGAGAMGNNDMDMGGGASKGGAVDLGGGGSQDAKDENNDAGGNQATAGNTGAGANTAGGAASATTTTAAPDLDADPFPGGILPTPPPPHVHPAAVPHTIHTGGRRRMLKPQGSNGKADGGPRSHAKP